MTVLTRTPVPELQPAGTAITGPPRRRVLTVFLHRFGAAFLRVGGQLQHKFVVARRGGVAQVESDHRKPSDIAKAIYQARAVPRT
jgi:hypothetical protein